MPSSPDLPEEGELVVGTVQNVKNFGAFVSLDEYGSKEAFIHVSEIATGWVKYIRDYVKEGQKIVCKVIEVDKSKGHVNLSLKQVNDHQRREKIQQWKNENKARKIIDILAERVKAEPSVFFDEVGPKLIESFGTLYASLEAAVADRNALKKAHISGSWTEAFIQIAEENITSSKVKVDGILEVSSPKPDGVDDIRNALMEGVVEGDDFGVQIQYIGAPKYRVVVVAPDYKKAEDELKKSSDKVVKAIVKAGGTGKFTRHQV
jgi:translation initiation factor 2 subunit 1